MNLKNYYVVGTPLLLGLDLLTGMALRVPGLEGSGLRWGYYLLLGAVAGVAVKRPSAAPFLAMGESVVNLFLVLLAILLPIWDPTPILEGGEPAILTGSQLLGSALAGAVLVVTFYRSQWERRGLAGLCVVITASCGQSEPPPIPAGQWTVRDSLGVTIVENTEPSSSEALPWRIAGRPRVEIGAIDGPDEYVFGRLRSAWRLSDNRIVAADEMFGEIRFFSPRGRYLDAVGRVGEGPGEFREIGSVRPFRGDSIFVFDPRLDRVSIFDSAGRFGRSVRTIVPAPNYWAVASLEDSLFALTSPGEASPPLGLSQDSSYLFAYHPDGERMDTLGRYPLALRYRGGTSLEPEDGFFLPHASFAPAGDKYYWGLGDRWEIEEYHTDGTLARVIRLDRPVEPLTGGRVARFKESWPDHIAALSGQFGEGNVTAMRGYVERAYFPEVLPAYSRLIADSEGYLWAERYRVPPELSQGWVVFDSMGRWVGHMAMPDHVRVEQIGPDFVLGIRADSLGVQSVVMFDLQRD